MQIAEYVRGRQRIVEHVGSARTETELGILLQRARELLANPAQGVLELGGEPTAPVKALVVEPISLLDVGRVLRDLGQAPASYATMKRTLGRAAAGKYRDRTATWCFERASTNGDVSLVLYDVTTLYFEAEKEDELRKVGYSKERRVDPGSKAETATIIPISKQFQARHGITDMVVVADAGMHSAGNLGELDEATCDSSSAHG